MNRISVNLWFDDQAETAAAFYTSIFGGSRIGSVSRYGEAGREVHGQEPGTVMTVEFELGGLRFTALNAGPQFRFTPATSFFVNCETEREVDSLWAALSEGGTALMPLGSYPFSRRYGWIADRYGVSWQVILSEGEPRQKVVPSLLFVGERCGQAEEAIRFYTSVFPDSATGVISRYGPDRPPDEEGTIAFADFRLEGQWFAAMDSAQDHRFDFTEATSFVVNCRDQAEVDYYWKKLSAVPEAEQCGWLKDRYGVSWQVVPTVLSELMQDEDPDRAGRVMEAMLRMKKLDIAGLKRAYDQARPH